MIRVIAAGVVLLLLSACGTTNSKRGQHVVLQVQDATVMCLVDEGIADFPQIGVDPPVSMADADRMLCELVEPRDYMPCRVRIEGEETSIWCPFPPGALWRMMPPNEQSF